MIAKDKKEYFKTLLNQRLNELAEEADRTVLDMTDQGDNFPDPTDRASLESDRNFTLRIRDRERKLIGKIKRGLGSDRPRHLRHMRGCGEDISEERLKARPVTTLCIECKTRQENEEKVRGV